MAGKPAGSTRMGYVSVAIHGRHFRAHRLIWKLQTGEDPGANEVDHINLDRRDNRWSNLRLATVQQNRANCRRKSRSDLPKGVKKNKGRFGARVTWDGVVHWLGTFDTPEEAHAAYCAKATELHGHFHRAA
jgi:hypothetical protein